jgi:hypothetical protein
MGVTVGGSLRPAASVSRRSTAAGLGCMALFLLPFGAAGIGAGLLAARRVAQGNLHEALPLLLFATVFGGVAAGGWRLLLLAHRKIRTEETLKARDPNQPWMWRPDWASGRISDSNRMLLWSSWIFATLWNLISWPSAVLAVRSAMLQGNTAAYVALLFPLAGTGLLVWAVRNTIRHKRYGASLLELSTIPAVIGHSLAGTIRVSSLLQPAEGFALTLSCVQRSTRDGNDDSSSETILWQEEQQVRGETFRDAGGMTTRVRVGFRIPADARGTDSSNPSDQTIWRLSISAGVSGIDYQASFELPVFRTAASELPAPAEDLRLARKVLDLSEYRQPRESRISVSRTQRGTEIVFPAARNPGTAFTLTVFTVFWTAAMAFMLYLKAPMVFPIVFGLFELLLLIGTLQLWLGVSRVTADRAALLIAHGYIYPGREQKIVSGEINTVTTRIGMQAGSQPYYDVIAVRKSGKQIAAGRWIRNKREAEWLAATMRTALGL